MKNFIIGSIALMVLLMLFGVVSPNQVLSGTQTLIVGLFNVVVNTVKVFV